MLRFPFFPWIAAVRGRRADATGLGLGALTALALPPLHVIPLLLLTIPGLLALLSGCGTGRTAARRGWWFGLGLNVVGLYWITEAILFEADRFWWLVPLAVPALASVLAVFTAATAFAAHRASAGTPRVLVLAGAWVLADIARQFVLTGFPWNPIGSVWGLPNSIGDVMIQPAALIGVHGMTLVTILLAAVPVFSVRVRLMGGAVLVLWAGFGLGRINGEQPSRINGEQPSRISGEQPSPAGMKIAIVQGNVAQGQKWDRGLAARIFQRYLDLTAEGVARAGGTQAVILWPETASPYLLEIDTTARGMIAAAAGGNLVLSGSVRFDAAQRPRNSVMAIEPNSQIGALYDKWHLVPFGEYQPSWASVGIQLVPGGGFAAGAGPRTLHPRGAPPVGPLICYEAIFSGQIVDASDRPAWMANVTNDAWFGNSSGPRQHLLAARFRAVEEGIPLMRAANTGISAAFDAYGHEIGRLGMRETGVLVVDLPGALPPTLFARLGLPIPGAMGVLCLAVAWLVRRRPDLAGATEPR